MFPIIKSETSWSIQEKFHLPPPGHHSQIWEHEVSVPDRIEEFLDGYPHRGLDDAEKVSLMAVILNSYSDLDPGDPRIGALWPLILVLLKADEGLLTDLIAYYADPGNAEEDSFPFAGRLRAAFPAIVEAALKAEVEE